MCVINFIPNESSSKIESKDMIMAIRKNEGEPWISEKFLILEVYPRKKVLNKPRKSDRLFGF